MYSPPAFGELFRHGLYTPPVFGEILYGGTGLLSSEATLTGQHGTAQAAGSQQDSPLTAVVVLLGHRGSIQSTGDLREPVAGAATLVGYRGTLTATALITLPLVGITSLLPWSTRTLTDVSKTTAWVGNGAAGQQSPAWLPNQPLARPMTLGTGRVDLTAGRRPARWGLATLAEVDTALAYRLAATHRQAATPRYGISVLRGGEAATVWEAAILAQVRRGLPWGSAQVRALRTGVGQSGARFMVWRQRLPWGPATWPIWREPFPAPPGPEPPGPPPYVPLTFGDLLFRPCYLPPSWGDILFGGLRGFTQFPSFEVYIIVPTANLVLLADSTEIPATSFTIDADVDSSYWRLAAQIVGRSAYNLLQPTEDGPATVQATAQGLDWNFIVDRMTGNLEFIQETFALTGRSACALLGAGWARARTFTETNAKLRQQLAIQEFDLTGWDVTPWDVADWLVSAKAFSYQGLTPMEALRRLVEVDGFILPDPTVQTIGVYPRYKVLPWLWAEATPDYALPADLITSVSIEPRPSSPGWDAVFVRGVADGFWKILRAGTLGANVPSEALVESLMTNVDAARAWGGRWLADAEPLISETLELPLAPPDIPLIPVGSLIQYSTPMGTYRGITRDLSVAVAMSGSVLTVMQTIKVERYG